MRFLRKYSITFQLFIFITILVGGIFAVSTAILYKHQKDHTLKQNRAYLNYHVESFHTQLNFAQRDMQNKVEEGIHIADWVFYRNYSGHIKESTTVKLKYYAVNQITLDTTVVRVNQWTMDGQKIHNNYKIVDKIKEFGPSTVTIFQKIDDGYLRISTNVINKKGERAIGTFIPNNSEVVQSIKNGNTYRGRAFVVDDWYTTIYEPIYIRGEIKGILYVGEKESEVDVINEDISRKRYFGDGYAFVMSNTDKFKGLMLMHPALHDINIRTSGDLEKMELYNQLLTNHNELKNETVELRLKDGELGEDVLCYYSYHPEFDYYFGLIIPYDSFIQKDLDGLVWLMFLRFLIGYPLSIIIIIFGFTFMYKKRLSRIIGSLRDLGDGIIPKAMRVRGHDEIAITSTYINRLARSNEELIREVQRIEKGEYGVKVKIKSDRDQLAVSFNNMAQKLYDLEAKHQHQIMMREAENDLFEKTRFSRDMEEFGLNALQSIQKFLPIQIGSLYTYHAEDKSFLYQNSVGILKKTIKHEQKLDSSLIGEVAKQKTKIRIINDVPEGFYKVKTGTGIGEPKQLLIIPLVLNDVLFGVMELASFTILSHRDMELLNVYKDSLSISINISKSRIETQALLEQIQVQSEELRVSHETLEKHTQSLQVSEENLQVQQEELRVTNEELEIQAQSLMKSEEAVTKQKEVLEVEMTKREEAQKQLELAVEKANAATKAKSMFLANMSHEIRTPMNGVIGISDIMAQTELTSEQQNYLKLISTSANNLLTIINDILDFSKIEAGKIEMEEIPFTVKSIIEDTADVLQFKAAEHNNELFTYVDNDVPMSLIGDPVRLQQVLMNLANNAVKFTKNGDISISCEVVELKEKKAHLIFKVKDTGIGISKEGQEKLFKSFTQVDASTTRKFGGTGLGLVISKKLVEKMNGSFGVESEEGEGSTFLFSASFDIDANESAKKNMENRDYSGLRILVVDNHEPSRMIFQKYLEAKNASILSTDSTSEGITMIENASRIKQPFQLVFVDYQMPDMNGVQFIDKVKLSEENKDIHFILLTAQQNVFSNEMKKKLQVSAYLDKPLKRLSLYHSVEHTIYGKIIGSDVKKEKKAIKKKEDNTKQKFKILLTEDNLINQKVAVYNLKEWGHEVEVADNGEISFQKYVDGKYDLILMDIQMPVLDGLKATKKIRAYEKKNKLDAIKIIAMTANALKGDDQICYDAGMDAYISKPFKREELEEIIYT